MGRRNSRPRLRQRLAMTAALGRRRSSGGGRSCPHSFSARAVDHQPKRVRHAIRRPQDARSSCLAQGWPRPAARHHDAPQLQPVERCRGSFTTAAPSRPSASPLAAVADQVSPLQTPALRSGVHPGARSPELSDKFIRRAARPRDDHSAGKRMYARSPEAGQGVNGVSTSARRMLPPPGCSRQRGMWITIRCRLARGPFAATASGAAGAASGRNILTFAGHSAARSAV